MREAERGVPFDRMAIFVRAPQLYAGLLETALSRAGVPGWYALGTRGPDPAGRAFLALLACAAEQLSARRFSEYLSLAQVPLLEDAGTPPGRREAWAVPATAPSIVVERATERAARLVNEGQADGVPAGDVDIIELPRDPDRPSGKRFGSLVHAVLATVPFESDGPGTDEIATLHGRILGATDAEVTAAVAATRAAIHHPVFERARAAFARGECLREVPVALRDDDDTLIEGVVDLAFAEDGHWTVVDFKTDQELDEALDVYRRQVALYAEMVGAATGQPVSPVLMRV